MKKVISAKVDPEIYEMVFKKAVSEHKTISDIVERAILRELGFVKMDDDLTEIIRIKEEIERLESERKKIEKEYKEKVGISLPFFTDEGEDELIYKKILDKYDEQIKKLRLRLREILLGEHKKTEPGENSGSSE